MDREYLIKNIEDSQNSYIRSRNNKYLKDNSQFFTPSNIAEIMVGSIMNELSITDGHIRVLEPSAGCGLLLVKLILSLAETKSIKSFHVTAYEKEDSLFPILLKNMDLLNQYLSMNFNGLSITFNLIEGNFITLNSDIWSNNDHFLKYDVVIANPPYNKINQLSDEALVMKDLIYGQPNLYSLFIAMSLKMLDSNGILSVLSPRNYLTGEYSKKIRMYIFDNYSLTSLHSFDKRNIFRLVNQEVVISTFTNRKNSTNIKVSHNGNFELITTIDELILDKRDLSVITPTSLYELEVFKRFQSFRFSLSDLGLKASVGPIVQFRNDEYLSKELFSEDYAPLLIVNDIQLNNVIGYFQRQNNPKRKTHNKSISIKARSLLKNSNYILVRKITAKDDKDIIITAILEDTFFKHKYLGLDNNLLYIHKLRNDNTLARKECYGLYCYINTTLFEKYYSLINGTHTINVSDFSRLKFPSMDTLQKLGDKLIKSNIFSKEKCNEIFIEVTSS